MSSCGHGHGAYLLLCDIFSIPPVFRSRPPALATWRSDVRIQVLRAPFMHLTVHFSKPRGYSHLSTTKRRWSINLPGVIYNLITSNRKTAHQYMSVNMTLSQPSFGTTRATLPRIHCGRTGGAMPDSWSDMWFVLMLSPLV